MGQDVSDSPKATPHFATSSALMFSLVGLNITAFIFPFCSALWCHQGKTCGFSLPGGTATASHLPTAACQTILESCSVKYLAVFLKQQKKKKTHLTLSSRRWHSIKYLFLRKYWNMFIYLTCILNSQSDSRFLQRAQICNPSTPSNFSSPIDSLAPAKHNRFQSQDKAVCGKKAGSKK